MQTTTSNRRSVLNNQRLKSANNKHGFGFNCWGATMYVLEMTDELEWASSYDTEEFLNTYTELITVQFEPKNQEEPPVWGKRVGDIVTLYDDYDDLEHTAVYVGRGRYFHKRGSNISEITDWNGVLYWYSANRIEIRRLGK